MITSYVKRLCHSTYDGLVVCISCALILLFGTTAIHLPSSSIPFRLRQNAKNVAENYKKNDVKVLKLVHVVNINCVYSSYNYTKQI